MFSILLFAAVTQAQEITTVAGNGTPGYNGDNIPATSAELYTPFGVAVDSAGNLYIADTYNNRIREVSAATGEITTVAGNGKLGDSGDNFAATSAELYYPEGVALDSNLNLYIADTYNFRIRKVSAATGVITTVAGGGSGCPMQTDPMGDGCPATSASLFYANGVAVDSDGNLYIADGDDRRIRKVSAATGIITTVAGGGSGCAGQTDSVGDGCPATSAELSTPTGVALDSNLNLYIADPGYYRIREVSAASGIITTVAGNGTGGYSGDGGPATSAELNLPSGVAVDSNGNLYIADRSHDRIRKVSVTTPDPLSKSLGASGCPTCGAPNTVGQVGVGYPISVGTGNMFEQVADYATAGQNPLSFTRYYNSLASTIYPNTFATTLGVNWRGTYDSYLHITPATGQATSVVVERADGQVIRFTFQGSTWTTDTDVDATLTQSGSTWTLKDHNDTVFSYTGLSTGEGLLNSITLRNGYAQTFTYSGTQLQTVTDSYGRKLGFSYASNGMLETVTTPDTLVLTYGFTAATGGNQLTSVSYNTSPVTSQTYVYGTSTLPFALTGIIDENKNRFATWTYNSLGQGLTSQHGTGTSTADLTTLTYSSTGTTTVTNAFGVADTYTFSTLQNVPKATQISRAATSTTAAATESFTYDANGYLASRTDWNGNKTTYVNNSHGLPTTIDEAVGSSVARTTTISYDATFVRLPHQIITPGLTSTFVYDGSGNPLSRTDLDTTTNTVPYSTNGQTREFKYTWSSTGQEESVQLPRTDVTAITKFGYNGGTLVSTTDALGHETQITKYTGGGLPETVIDPNKVTTTLAYDLRLNLHTSTLETTAGNLVTTWTYDPANNLTRLQLPDNSELTYGYDTAHRLTSITDLLGNSIAYTLDKLGDTTLAEAKNASDTVTQEHSGTFDALGRVLHDIGGVGQTTAYTYDKNGNALTITPPSPSGVVTYTFDALNRRSTAKDPSPGGTTTNTYDAHDRILSVKDANGHTTSYVYDGFGDRTQTGSPDSGTTVYHYNPDRDLTQAVTPGPLTANMTYDALDRLLATTYPSDSTLNVSRTYDQATGHGFGIGRLTSATDQVGSLSLTYDERANVTQESRVATSAGTLTTVTTYDAASRVSGIAYPSGTLVAYGRDSMGRVTSVTAKPPGAASASNVATGITYEPFGPETALTFGNGIKGAYGYDLDYRPTTRVDTGTAAVQNLTYAYFANNSVQKITDAVNAANTQTLGYDALDRITSAASGTGGYGTYSFTWDPVSNIETQVINGTTTTYSLASGTNRLSQWVTGSTTETVASTAAGNIATLKAGSTTLDTLAYNQANQMASAQTPSSSATYKYDLVGQRLEKALPGSNPILYQFSRTGGQLLAENDLHKGQTADYIYLSGRPIGEVNPTTGTLYFTHTDRLGTPQSLTASTQAVAWHTTYQPFGGTSLITGPLVVQSLRLPGQQFDPESGFNHNGFRDYAPTLTRYLETDPIGLAGGMNTYQYVGENPISRTDRLGLQFENEKDIETTPFQSLQDELNELGLPYINPLTGESEVNILENKYAAENLENISEVLDVFNTYQEYLQNQSQHSVQSNAVCTAQNPQATPSPNNEVLRAPYIVKLSP
jgi:RHS repeat-associated protein